jgi:hypothetical protein
MYSFGNNQTLEKFYSIIGIIEEFVYQNNGVIEFVPDNLIVVPQSTDIILFPPLPCDKYESLNCALVPKKYGANANRVIVNNRLLFLHTSLEKLKNIKSGADDELHEFTSKLWLEPKSGGLEIENRYYEENTIVCKR